MATESVLPLRAAAVLPAAGQARRFGSGENKIWATLAGYTVLEWTLSAFQAHPAIETIALVVNAEDLDRVLMTAMQYPKVRVTAGGTTRSASVRNGLNVLPQGTEVVLVHDAARPMVTQDLIDRILAGVAKTGAAVPGLPLSDTIKRVDNNGLVRATILREETVGGETLGGLTAVQTPQGARLDLLRQAYAAHDFALSEPTDEASLLESIGQPIAVVEGDPTNIKITRPADLLLAERLLGIRDKGQGTREEAASDTEFLPVTEEKAASNPLSLVPNPSIEVRTGFGYDVHAFADPEAGRRLFLGGVEIPHDRGLEGHSDADVLLHAVCDALLGAASLGDIGILFPNTDATFKNISSLRLLTIVGEKVQKAGWTIMNIDAAIVAEAPKLMPHRAAMQEAMASCLQLEPSRISVKATTSERMGFVGRGEGMACWAVATLRAR